MSEETPPVKSKSVRSVNARAVGSSVAISLPCTTESSVVTTLTTAPVPESPCAPVASPKLSVSTEERRLPMSIFTVSFVPSSISPRMREPGSKVSVSFEEEIAVPAPGSPPGFAR